LPVEISVAESDALDPLINATRPAVNAFMLVDLLIRIKFETSLCVVLLDIETVAVTCIQSNLAMITSYPTYMEQSALLTTQTVVS